MLALDVLYDDREHSVVCGPLYNLIVDGLKDIKKSIIIGDVPDCHSGAVDFWLAWREES